MRKCIVDFRSRHEQTGVNTLQLLVALYEHVKAHPGNIIQLYHGCPPRLDEDGTFTVHLSPVGRPCTGPPEDEQNTRAAVRGVVTALDGLHSAGALGSAWQQRTHCCAELLETAERGWESLFLVRICFKRWLT